MVVVVRRAVNWAASWQGMCNLPCVAAVRHDTRSTPAGTVRSLAWGCVVGAWIVGVLVRADAVAVEWWRWCVARGAGGTQ